MSPGSRIVLRNVLREDESPFDLAADARAGLTDVRKSLPSKYFYDARGSHLFDLITRLPEYYLTRAETEILEREAGRLVDAVLPRALVEFGSGAARKTRILLDEMRARGLLEGYAPFDVSVEASRHAADTLIRDYPELRVEGVIGDFERPHDLPFAGRPRLIALLGSTIGNLEREQAAHLLRSARAEMTAADGFLIGFDLIKNAGVLERAYNDAAGVTAKFNLNMLRVLNRELGADFDVARFSHRATWNPGAARIEMHVVSEVQQVVSIPSLDLEVSLAAGETIRTELCHKYDRARAGNLLSEADLRMETWVTDREARFGLGLARIGS